MGAQYTKAYKRIFLVNRELQLRYARSAIAVGLISTLLTAVVILYPLYQFQILRLPRFLPVPILLAMVSAALINITIVGFMGILVTHRIAGPMYSLVRSLRRISLGHYGGQMQVREEDDLKFVIRNFNDMLESLRRNTLQDLQVIEKAIEGLEAGETHQLNTALKKELRQYAEQMKKRLFSAS